MARGYINTDGNDWRGVVALQGSAHELDPDFGYGACVKSAVSELEPGLYRASFIENDGYLSVTVGRSVRSASAEARRLRRLAGKQSTRARTNMPGIAGYQRMADVATARLVALRSESFSLAHWLDHVGRAGEGVA